MPDKERQDRAREAIETAFADTPYPRDGVITLPPSNYRTEPLEQGLRDIHWRDAPRDLLSRSWPHLLSPAARRFYLPAYMLMAVDRMEENSTALRVLYALEPPEMMGWFEREYGAYTPSERHAICLFLELARDTAGDPGDLRDRKVAQDALERYWARGEGPTLRGEVVDSHRASVEHKIRDAFVDVPYPGDDAIGYSLDDWEGFALNRDFKGYHWRELPRDALADHHHDLSFFSARGEQFYLPAYLLASLDDFYEIRDPVIYHLSPSVDQRLRDWFESRSALFTAPQRDAIKSFLEHERDQGEERFLAIHCQIALDEYWDSKERKPVDPARKEALRHLVLNAFADVPCPEDNGFLSDDRRHQAFQGHSFRDIPLATLIEHDRLAGFNVAGLHHFLPAYLLAAVEDAGYIVYWVVESLCPCCEGEEHLAYFARDFFDYTLSQKQAVVRFLEYVRDHMPHRSLAGLAQKALDRYWTRAAAG